MIPSFHARASAWLVAGCRRRPAFGRALHTNLASPGHPHHARRLFWYSTLAITAAGVLASTTVQLDAPHPIGDGQDTERSSRSRIVMRPHWFV